MQLYSSKAQSIHEDEMLTQKIYMPHLISNLTILEFGRGNKDERFSIKDIIGLFYEQTKSHYRLYFKVDTHDSKGDASTFVPGNA